ncbi:McrB family protein [Leuconostoc mesenteroides]|uniref:McrB family protein n=1 Tax=Leuconostoc mesenteroides TaxID=1245 RepID=UPI002953751F|nr:hypothetical protein [Leuconostoc mesenteroides]
MLTTGKQDFKVVGYLNSMDDISINANGYAFIKLKTISDVPESIDINDFHGDINIYVSKFNMVSLYDNIYDADEVRIQNIWEALDPLLISVTPYVKSDTDRPNKYWWWGDNVEVQKLSPNFNKQDEIKLINIPVFSKDNSSTGIDKESDFELALESNKLLGKLKSDWPHDEYDVPEAVIWKTTDFDLTVYSGIDQQNFTNYGVIFTLDSNKAQKVHISEDDSDWFNSQYQFKDIIYVSSDTLFSEYKKANLLMNTKHSENVVITEKDENISTEKRLERNEFGSKLLDQKSSKETEFVVDKIVSKDFELIKRLKENTLQKGLYYSEKDLVNFHVSMKTDGMVILSGLSGTGKSKLVTEYANALQLSSSENASRSQVRFVPVRPFWADDSDLLGYADTVNNVYRPGDSGLIDTLVDAQIHSEDLFIIVFDEMNLARVEHYFSQFLSVLEMSAGTRVLKLYNQQLESRLYNSEKYPANISIGENVLFVGTVNTDESTYQFSDKVLDRSNVMTLEMIPFGSAELLDYSTPIHVKREPVKTDDFKKMKKINPEAHLTTADKNMLWDLHQAINQVDVNVGIGWRIVKQIDQYLMNLPFDVPTLSRSNSLDMQIVQRILTKIRGSEDQIRELVGKTTPEGKHSNGKLEDILDSYDNLSKFDQSRKIIERKSRELNVYGFTV